MPLLRIAALAKISDFVYDRPSFASLVRPVDEVAMDTRDALTHPLQDVGLSTPSAPDLLDLPGRPAAGPVIPTFAFGRRSR